VHKKFGTAEEALRLAERLGVRVVVPVLPLSFLQRIAEEAERRGILVLYAEMERLHIDLEPRCADYHSDTDAMVPTRGEDGEVFYRHFRFRGFKVLVGVEIVTRPLTSLDVERATAV